MQGLPILLKNRWNRSNFLTEYHQGALASPFDMRASLSARSRQDIQRPGEQSRLTAGDDGAPRLMHCALSGPNGGSLSFADYLTRS